MKKPMQVLSGTLDDFDVVLGVEFLTEAKVSLMPHLNSVLVNDETTLCFVQATMVNPSFAMLGFMP